MEYPGSHFNHPLRIAMLLVFTAAFFIISPTLILYSAGYRYDFRNGLLRETGSLSVDILPESTTVTLDGVLLSESMPLRLNNLTPHKYTIKLSAEGYYDLQQEIEIHKNQTTYFKEISLLKKTEPTVIKTGTILAPSVSADGAYLAYYEKKHTTNEVYIMNLGTSVNTVALRLTTTTPLTFSWHKKLNYVIVSNAKAPYTLLYIINAARPANPINALAKSTVPTHKFLWQDASEPIIYFDSSTTIFSYSPIGQLVRPIAEAHFIDWYSNNENIWSLDYSTSTREFTVRGDTFGFSTTLATLKNTSDTNSAEDWHLVTVSGNSALIKNDTDKQFYIVRSNAMYHFAADTFYLSPYNNWWLLTSPWEIWTYSDGGEPNLLTRTDAALIDVRPLDEYNTLALVTEKNIAALYPYYFIKQNMIAEPIKAFAASPTKHTLYYTTDSGLWQLTY